MNKVLQALLDTILLVAGTVELGGAIHSPANTSPEARQRSAREASAARDLSIARERPDSESGARTGTIKNQPSA
jgi:hypothetical protein